MNKNQTIFPFVELAEYPFSETKAIVPDQLFIDGLCSRKLDKLVFNFSGVVINNDTVFIVFPKGYVIPEEDTIVKKHAMTLLDTLIRYGQENDIDRYEKELLGGIGDNTSNAAAAFLILKDYLSYGFINIQNESYKINGNGRINWSRTVKQHNPVLTNGQAVYLDYVTKVRNVDLNNFIYQIHRYAVYQAISLYGWLLNIDVEVEEVDLTVDYDTAIHYLQLELQQTFVDREIHLYNQLIEFLKGSIQQEKQDKVITFLTPHFHTVWEKICDFIFNGVRDFESIIPRPFWNINNQLKYTRQIPDTIFRSNQKLFILDAKYYRLEKLPGWGDLVKQFFYAKTIHFPSHEIKNILVFPATNEDGSLIAYLGFAEIEGRKQFGTINGYKVDVYKAMQSYAYYHRSDFQQDLIQFETNHH